MSSSFFKGYMKLKGKRKTVWNKSEGICYLCGKEMKMRYFTLDHVVPLHLNGSNKNENLRATHLKCNRLKSHMTLEEFTEFLEKDVHLSNQFKNGILLRKSFTGWLRTIERKSFNQWLKAI